MATATVYRTTSSFPSARVLGWLGATAVVALVLAMAVILVLHNARWVDAQQDMHQATRHQPPEITALSPLAPPASAQAPAAEPRPVRTR
jgi:hypothetical protein